MTSQQSYMEIFPCNTLSKMIEQGKPEPVKSPRSTTAKVVVPDDFQPSAQVVVNKQDSSFQNWKVSIIHKIYSAVGEYY